MTSSSILTNTTLKIVVDTNQFLSVFVFRGLLTKLIFELVIDNRIDLYVSPALKSEVSQKLHYFGVNKQIENEVIHFIETKGILAVPTVKVTVCRDSEDNFLLELTETVKADFLITRDNDLLSLPKNTWKVTKIMKPEVFLHLLRTKKLIE